MNILDLIIAVALVYQAIEWARAGFARRFFSLTGFWLGVFAGALLTPLAVGTVQDPLLRLILALFVIFSMASLFGTLGRILGYKLRQKLLHIRLRQADAVLGAAFSVLTGLAIVWTVAAIIGGTPFQTANRLVRDSIVVQQLNDTLPPPPEVFSRIAGLINPDRFPQIFVGPEPRPIAPVTPPSSADVSAALNAAGDSVVRLESPGCGGVVFGSGFVAAPNTIVTNAHVVSGIRRPLLTDANGRREGRIIYFDPELDMAVIKTDNLAGPPLEIDTSTYKRGTAAVTLGFPGGGRLEATEAAVLRHIIARGRDIYNRRTVDRSVYMLQTSVEPGNSGGPVVLPDGTVIGMIFGRSEAEPTVGYAVTGSEIVPRLNQALASNQTVSTGVCVR